MHSISKNEFRILSSLSQSPAPLSQRQIAAESGLSLGSVNKLVRDLREKGLLGDQGISRDGREALEPYRVKRAIFMAAGFGARLVPVTLDIPKPLIPVKGQRLIDGLIDAVLAAGIEDIVVVRGYKAAAFDVLLEKYPMIRFVENPDYAEANNILSAMKVKDELSNSYIFDADLLLHKPRLIAPYHYESNFLGVYCDRTDDWCFSTKGEYILEEKRGGLGCYQVIGISYWNQEDGEKMARDLPLVASMPGGREYYWEQVPMAVLKENYRVAIRPCQAEDVIEIDTFNELKQLDSTYINYGGSHELVE